MTNESTEQLAKRTGQIDTPQPATQRVQGAQGAADFTPVPPIHKGMRGHITPVTNPIIQMHHQLKTTLAKVTGPETPLNVLNENKLDPKQFAVDSTERYKLMREEKEELEDAA